MKTQNKFKKNYLPLLALQIFSVILLAITFFAVKYFSKPTYLKLVSLYVKYFETDITETNEKEVAQTVTLMPIVYYSENKELTESINSFCTPLYGEITSEFGEREDPFDGNSKMHKGTDIAGEKGKEILAAQDGVVSYVGYEENGYGNYLSIAHSDILKTVYAHCSKVLVKQGEIVKKGQKVALVGSTGASTGNHLHFEIRINNLQVNPEDFVEFK